MASTQWYPWYETEIFFKHVDYSINFYIPHLSMAELNNFFLLLFPCLFGEHIRKKPKYFGTVQSCIFFYLCNLTYLTSNRTITEERCLLPHFIFARKQLTSLQVPGTVIHPEILLNAYWKVRCRVIYISLGHILLSLFICHIWSWVYLLKKNYCGIFPPISGVDIPDTGSLCVFIF